MMKILTKWGFVFGASVLAACTLFEPDYTACPSLKAVEGAERIAAIGTKLGQPISMRINGVDAKCVAADDGFEMDIALGIIARRDISENGKTEEVILNATFAFLDEDDQVVRRQMIGEKVFFPSLQDTARPIFEFSIDIPAGTRVIMGLGKPEGEAEPPSNVFDFIIQAF